MEDNALSLNKNLLRILLVILAITVSGTVIAQVSNHINLASVLTDQKLNDSTQTNPSNLPVQNDISPEIPVEVVYDHIFSHIDFLNNKATEEERNNLSGTMLRNRYKDEAKLDERQARSLDRIAYQTNQELKKIDQQVELIVKKVRANYPQGRVPQGQKPPLPPQELLDLDTQRTNLLLQAINNLRAEFGEAEFTRFTEFVNQKIRPKISIINKKKRQ